MAHNITGASAVVGTTIPIAVGFALTFKRMRTDSVVVAFFGDGATEEGVFAESLNFASLHKLPILFVCENNFYAIHTPLTRRWATQQLCERVETYGIQAHRINDGNVFNLRQTAVNAVALLRRGEGPQFIECRIYRWLEHVGPNEDFDAGYRSRSEQAPWVQDDQIVRVGELIEPTRRSVIDKDIEQEVEDAIAFAESSPFPDTSALLTNVFASQ
jgi:pyruvate dehydrogenase E1 component alpha subunit